MRPRRGETCDARDASQSCPERFDAVLRGEFIHQDYVGWLWLKKGVDHHTPWDFCPWCGQTLPDLAEEDATDELDRIRQADGDVWDGEDGG